MSRHDLIPETPEWTPASGLGGNPVVISIDPFFFHLHWHEDTEREERPEEIGQQLVIEGLRYERVESEYMIIERPRK